MQLKDDNGFCLDVEFLDNIRYNDKDYTLFYPLKDNEQKLALIVEQTKDGYIPVMDEDVLGQVYNLYEERTTPNRGWDSSL